MKAKCKKIIAGSLAAAVIAAVSAYTWLPGTKTVAKQGVKGCRRPLSVDRGRRCLKHPPGHHSRQHDVADLHVAVGL